MLSFLATIGTFASIYALLALGLNIMWGMTGMVNLGIMGYYAIGAYSSALLSLKFGLPVPISLAIGVGLASLVGAATCIGVVRVKEDYLAIVTLGFSEAVRLVAENEVWLTNGTDGLTQIPQPWRESFSGGAYGFFYVGICLVALGVGLFLAERLRRSPMGRVLRAIRDDPPVAAAAGKNVLAFQVRALAFGAALMGLAGGLYAHYTSYVSPDVFAAQRLILIFFAINLGGRGNNWGAAFGAFAFMAIDETARFVISEIPGLSATQVGASRQIIVALGFLLILHLRPSGLFPEPVRKLKKPAQVIESEPRAKGLEAAV